MAIDTRKFNYEQEDRHTYNSWTLQSCSDNTHTISCLHTLFYNLITSTITESDLSQLEGQLQKFRFLVREIGRLAGSGALLLRTANLKPIGSST
jgi:hypothetical protein